MGRHCIACGQSLPEGSATRQELSDAEASVTMHMDGWFHPTGEVVQNFLIWKHCASCGGELVGEGGKKECASCSKTLPALYQYCARGGQE